MKFLFTALLFCFASNLFFSQKVQDSTIVSIQEVVIKNRLKPIVKTPNGIQLNIAGTALEQKENVNELLKFAPNISQVPSGWTIHFREQ